MGCSSFTEVSVREGSFCSPSIRCLLFLHRHHGAPTRRRDGAEHARHHHRRSHTSHQPIRMLGSAAVEAAGPAAPPALPHQAHEVKFNEEASLFFFIKLKIESL